MAVDPAGFSERIFEFAFNAEFVHKNRAVLAGAPDIPTQNAEKWLGYDVKFEVLKRGATHSIALQHKVARFVTGASGSNAKYRNAIGGPYFAFPLDVDQFNLIEGIASRGTPHSEFFFCAPCFTHRKTINSHFVASTILANSIWFDIKGVGQLAYGPHTLGYSKNGSKAFVFSDKPRQVKTIRPNERPRLLTKTTLTSVGFHEIYETADEVLREYWPRRQRQPRSEGAQGFRLPTHLPAKREPRDLSAAIEQTIDLFSRYYGLSWLIEVQE